jgi:O-antigen chain-terminating methyltransferase
MAGSYLSFEERFRGSFETVREEQGKYLRFFSSAPVVDLGCGRGEFLDLLREAGMDGWGVDAHPEMVAAARGRGLAVKSGEVIETLAGQPEGSLGGIFMCHVIEHLPRPQVLRFVELAASRLQPGGALVIETLNPQCVFAHAPFTMDLTHEWPIHPQTLQFLLEAHGFGDFETIYREYLPEEMLRVMPSASPQGAFDAAVVEAFRKLQTIVDLAFRHFIYALAAKKPATSNSDP